MSILTKEKLEALVSDVRNGGRGWPEHTCRALGVWPLIPNWKDLLIGQEIDDTVYDQIYQARNLRGRAAKKAKIAINEEMSAILRDLK